MILSLPTEADTLNQITSTNASSSYIYHGALGSLLGEFLLGYDPETWRAEKPLLAESYPEISEDNLTYTFTLRDGVQWHDGVPFTYEDVLFSVKVMMIPFVDSASLRGYFVDLADVNVDGRRVSFRMSRPYWMNDNVLGFNLPILPKHVYDPGGILDGYSYPDIISSVARDDDILRSFGERFNRHPANRQPIGTGPYRFENWESGFRNRPGQE